MTPMQKTTHSMRMSAAQGVFRGEISNVQDRTYVDACSRQDNDTGTVLLFMRESGHAAARPWLDAEHDRCLHMAISCFDPATKLYVAFQPELAKRWVDLMFAPNVRGLLWIETPQSPMAKARGVHDYRLFCDPFWRPFASAHPPPFVAMGWHRYSEIHGSNP